MSVASPVYLDHNATTAPAPEAVEAMLQALRQDWANPSSMHAPGQAARQRLGAARAALARVIGCQPAELVFTSGATESNHAAVLGALSRGRALGRTRLLLSAVEHPGLLGLAERLRAQGTPVDLLPVDARGVVDVDAAARLIGPDVALLSVMAANNETGVCMPLQALSVLARAHGVPFHVDATQALGKCTLRFDASGADLWSVSAHKLHGPKGVGALVIRKGLDWPPLIGGRQERHRRGGTENAPGIAGFAAAATRVAATLEADLPRIQGLRDRLAQRLRQRVPALVVFGEGAPRLPNTLGLRFGTLDAERVLHALEREGIVASSGAACAAGGTEPSAVLLAMGCTPHEARAGIRFSLGRDTTDTDIARTLAAVERAIVPLLAELAAAA
ncbi:cysteine desulfurase [Ideonella sp. 4Y11]|uniref:Cysteine desulfurase n=1 Tax=Ideonella aquatica TaxID=2824119 RepID=A0A940YJF3_9BURK|nr:cysteine desulfurase family protein [Ideonella aquatica]MBQ0961160.1 cysteine desulfurase [Ideonella aquatica]